MSETIDWKAVSEDVERVVLENVRKAVEVLEPNALPSDGYYYVTPHPDSVLGRVLELQTTFRNGKRLGPAGRRILNRRISQILFGRWGC